MKNYNYDWAKRIWKSREKGKKEIKEKDGMREVGGGKGNKWKK